MLRRHVGGRGGSGGSSGRSQSWSMGAAALLEAATVGGTSMALATSYIPGHFEDMSPEGVGRPGGGPGAIKGEGCHLFPAHTVALSRYFCLVELPC